MRRFWSVSGGNVSWSRRNRSFFRVSTGFGFTFRMALLCKEIASSSSSFRGGRSLVLFRALSTEAEINSKNMNLRISQFLQLHNINYIDIFNWVHFPRSYSIAAFKFKASTKADSWRVRVFPTLAILSHPSAAEQTPSCGYSSTPCWIISPEM